MGKRKKKKVLVQYEAAVTQGNPCRFYRNPYEDLLQQSLIQRNVGWGHGIQPFRDPSLILDPRRIQIRGNDISLPMSPVSPHPDLPRLGYVPDCPGVTMLDVSDLETFFDGRIPYQREHVHVNSSPGVVASNLSG